MPWQPLNENDVVSVDSGNLPYSHTRTAQVVDLLKELKEVLGEVDLVGGYPCNVLQPGGEWATGEIRIRIEFRPTAQAE